MYTHDFEIKIDGIEVRGELFFGEGETETTIKCDDAQEMTLHQRQKVQRLFEVFDEMTKSCDHQIDTIELKKK